MFVTGQGEGYACLCFSLGGPMFTQHQILANSGLFNLHSCDRPFIDHA